MTSGVESAAQLDLADLSVFVAGQQQYELYQRLRVEDPVRWDPERDGGCGFILPCARAAGVYDELVAEHGLFDLHAEAAAVYDKSVSGVATEMISRLFLTGSWGVPVPDGAA